MLAVLPVRGTVPRIEPPLSKTMTPVGEKLVEPVGLTVAVRTSGWPTTEGLGETVKVVAVLTAFTVWVKVVETLALKLPSPLYDAVSAWVPPLRAEVVIVAWPETRLAAGWEIPSMAKTTLPVGVPMPGATALIVAVMVTALPRSDGFADELRTVELLEGLTFCGKSAELLEE